MKKKLYFDNKNDRDNDSYIHIINGRIRKYTGFPLNNLDIFNKEYLYKTTELNSDFKLLKISKYDRKLRGVKANYKIISKVTAVTLYDYSYIKLNFIEKFIIQFSRNETLIQEKEIKRLIFTTLIITLPASIITTISTNFVTNQPVKNQESKKEVSNDVKTDTTTIKTTKKM